MGKYLVRRAFHSVIVVVGVVLLVFVVLRMSGDPAVLLMPPGSSPEEIAEYRVILGLDDPVVVQLWRYLCQLARGDFGESFRHGIPAMGLVTERLPATALLAVNAMILAFLVGVVAGMGAAVRRGSWVDRVAIVASTLGVSIPPFWFGTMLILIFAVVWRILPSSGFTGPSSMILPTLTLALPEAAILTRFTRSTVLEILGEDYVRTARAKGLGNRVVLYKHVLRNALIPIVSLVGMRLALLMGGAIVTESVFAWPGLGRLLVSAVSNRDFPVVQAGVFVVAGIFVVLNLLTDLLYACIDPRIRYS